MIGEDLAFLITAVAISTAQSLSDDELELLGATFTQLADTYFTLAICRSLKSENDEKPK